MDWPNEHWIKLYKHDSAQWLQNHWKSRCMFWLLLRRVDRSGRLVLGDLGRPALSNSLYAPWREIEKCVDDLVQDGCIELHNNEALLVVPNFTDAQDSCYSGKARARNARDRAKEAKGKRVQPRWQQNGSLGRGGRGGSMTLDWPNEMWVKAFVRDTAQWLHNTWQARGLFFEILRKVERSGKLSLGPLGIRALATLIHAPWKQIEPHVEELLRDGCIELVENGQALLLRNFHEAQNSRLSNAAKLRRSRQKAKELAEQSSRRHPPKQEQLFDHNAETGAHDLPHTSGFEGSGRGGEPVENLFLGGSGPLRGKVSTPPATQKVSVVTKQTSEESDESSDGCDRSLEQCSNSISRGAQIASCHDTNDTFCVGFDTKGVDRDTKGVDLGVQKEEKRSDEIPDPEEERPCDGRGSLSERSGERSDMAKQSKPKAPKGRAFIDTVLAEAEAIAPAQRDQPEPEPQLVLPGVEPVKTKQQRETEQRKNLVLKVWGRYIERWRLAFPQRLKNEPQLLGERVRLIDKMLKAYRAEALIIAIDAMFDNPWRVENGHYQLEAAIKDGERIDRLLGEAQDPKVKDRQGKVVPIRRPNQITQSLPETSEGYHARIHFTDDGWVDADGKPIETPSVEALSRYGRGSS